MAITRVFFFQTVSKLLELYLKLRDLGHPDYAFKESISSVKCQSDIGEVRALVSKMESEVTSWKTKVAELHSLYNWLLYFSVPKLLLLHQLLLFPTKEDTCENIVHEISFLPVKHDNLAEEVQVSNI